MRIYALTPSSSDSETSIDARLVRTIKPHSAPVVVSSIDSTGTLLATGAADGSVKVWDIRRGFTTHTLHGHSGLVSALRFFQVEVTSSDSRAKSRKRKSRDEDEMRMDIDGDTSEATLGFRLASGGEDGKIRVWDLHKRKGVAVLDSHVSVVRSLDFSPQTGLLLSASRDKTAILWDSKSWQVKATIPVLEGIESAGFVVNGQYFYTGGETARLRIWDVTGQERTEEQEVGDEIEGILDVQHFAELPFLLTVHANQMLMMHSLAPLQVPSVDASIPPLPVIRRISGTHDEVIDLAYIGLDSKVMALATNEEDIRLINIDRGSTDADAPYFGADVGLLKGHDDIIITIDTDWSGHWLATGAKDNTAKLWRLDPANSSYTCYATFTGHAESISAVALPHAAPVVGSQAYNKPLEHPPTFMITGSQDKTIKRWDIAGLSGSQSKSGTRSTRATYTRKAHDKDINAIDTSYSTNQTMFASASQDRTVKIWDLESGESIGVLRGHKRGVWSIAFSPPSMPAISGESGTSSGSRGMAVTGSGDKTVRIWSLNDYSCLRTFEGHTNSVLKVLWLPPPTEAEKKRNARGVQVASAAGDGLVKVWDAQSGECAATLDNHIDRVWALAVKPSRNNKSKREASGSAEDEENDDETSSLPTEQLELVSGSADSTLTFWHDTTTQTSQAATSRATQRVEQDQALQNAIHNSSYREAIVLSLQLNHPKRLLQLFIAILALPEKSRDEGSMTGRTEVDTTLASLSDGQLWKLLLRLRDWNANARTSRIAQRVLYILLHLYPKEKFVALRKTRRNQSTTTDDADTVTASLSALGLDAAKDDARGEKGAKGNENVKDVLEGLKAYTERHKQRTERMAAERHVLVWTLQCMDFTEGDVEGGHNGIMMLE